MYRDTIIKSREDLPTMNRSYSYESTGFDKPSNHSTKQNHQQAKITTYYEADHSPTSRRLPSPPTIYTSNNNNNNNRHNNERAKSVDRSRIALNEAKPIGSSYINTSHLSRTTTNERSNRNVNTRSSSKVYIDELRTAEEENEKRELNILNLRFGNYLDKIKHLATINKNLRQQVDDAYKKYMGYTDEQLIEFNNNNDNNIKNSIKKYQHPLEIQLNNLRKQINDEVRAQSLIQIRLQRADYDIKFYQKNIKLLALHEQKQSEQIRTIKQELEVNIQELNQLKRQYERRGQDLQMYKNQYDEYMNKLMEYSDEYDKIIYERMENENHLYTLKEQLSFEQEYYQRRQQEFEYIEKFQYDFNKEFNKNEFHNIVKQIRQDYQEFNAIRLAELENLYKIKLETIKNEILKRQEQQEVTKTRDIYIELDSVKKEHRTFIEQNQLLKNKLEQLEQDLHHIIEQNRQHYEVSDREYKQLQNEIPELDYIIIQLRDNAVNLWSEINTYRYLLVNLLSTTNEKSTTTSTSTNIEKNLSEIPISNKITTVGTKTKSYPQQYRDETTGFVVHIEDGIIWVRI